MRRLCATFAITLSLMSVAAAAELPLSGAYAVRYPGQQSEAIDADRCLFSFSLFEGGEIAAYLLDLNHFAQTGKPVYRRYPAAYRCDYDAMPELAPAGVQGVMACRVTATTCDATRASCPAERSHQVVRKPAADGLRVLFVSADDFDTIKSYAGKALPASLRIPATGQVTYESCSVPAETLKGYIDGSYVDEASFRDMGAQSRYWDNVRAEPQRIAAAKLLPKLREAVR